MYMKFACAALVIGLASCDKEPIAEVSGETTTLSLNLSFAQGNTRATADANATADETTVKTIDVYIFDASTNALANHKRLSVADFEANGDEYTNKVQIETTEGSKSIAVGVNLPDNFSVTSLGSLKQVWETTIGDLTSAAKGFVMFSKEPVTANLVAKTDADFSTRNTIASVIERVVAKVGVKKDANLKLDLGSGRFINPKFTVRQSNKKLFPLQLKERNVVKDPNWDAYSSSDFENDDVYVALNDGTSTAPNWRVKYAGENTSKNPVEANSTYASIEVTFVPKYFHDTGTPELNKDANGNVFYFKTETLANSFALSNGGSVVGPYTKGACYYSAYLNPDDNYSTIRNKFYMLNIKSLLPPGQPSPAPSTPDAPLASPTDISFDVEIAAWDTVEKDYELL